ncbi:MAG: ATP-binding protein [Natrialbaceae archaeon]|nr:ATP-binding protein [Natrialbaceae archaeon]
MLNAVTIIQGYNDIQTADAREAIEEEAETIVRSIEQVKYLSGAGADTDPGSIELSAPLEEAIEAVESAHPETTISRTPTTKTVSVRGDYRLQEIFINLLENAVTHTGEEPTVSVDVEATDHEVRVGISDDGPGLPESQQSLLERGDIHEFDDPTTGFGLNFVRILIEEFDGHIETSVTEDGTTVTVVLRRTDGNGSAVRGAISSAYARRPLISSSPWSLRSWPAWRLGWSPWPPEGPSVSSESIMVW